MSGSANLPVRITVEGAQAAEATFNQVGAAGERAMTRAAGATNQAGTAATRFGEAMGAAGPQLQDFFVQIQGGTSVLTALSQQGSQFLQFFGAGGAIAGAALVVGTLALQFLGLGENGKDAAKGVDEMGKALERAAEDAKELVEFLDRVNSRFLSTIENARNRTVRDIGTDNTRLDLEIQGSTFAAANQRAIAGRTRAELAALDRTFAPGDGSFDAASADAADQARRAAGERLRVQLDAAEAEAARQENQLRRLQALRDRNEGLLAGLVADSSASSNPGRPDTPDKPRATGTQASSETDLERTLANLRGRVEGGRSRDRERFEDIVGGTSPRDRALRDYEKGQEQLNDFLNRGIISEQEFTEAVEGTTLALGRQLEELDRRGRRGNDMGRELGMTFSSAFEDAILKGKEFSEVLKGIAQDIARIVLRQTVTAPLANALGSLVGSFFGPSAAPATTTAYTGGGNPSLSFGGPRANGGPVTPGNWYMVGERGPEPFIPSTPGTILPNETLGGQTVNVNLAIDARGAGPREIDILRQQIPGLARAAVQDATRRGGTFGRTMRG